MASKLKLGLGSFHWGSNANPEKMIRIAQLAELEGFDSIWLGGHPFLSKKQSRIPSGISMLDPVVALSFLAAQTRTIRLATGILLLPQFNPMIVAKEFASLDVLSNGRLILGVGVGWSEHEYQVLDLPYRNRGKRADEYLEVIKEVWTKDDPTFKGDYVSFEDIQSFPHPVQKPHPPIVIGGNSAGSFRRAVQVGNGWFGYGLTPEQAEKAITGLREAATEYPRPPELGELEITVTPTPPVEISTAEQFDKLGVHRIVLIPPPNADVSATDQFIKNSASSLDVKI